MLLESRVAHPTSVEEAVRLAREIYGLDVDGRSLCPANTTTTFICAMPVGASLCSRSCTRLASALLSICNARLCSIWQSTQAAIPLPRVIPAQNGELQTEITAADGTQRLVWMLTFVPGTMLAEVRPHSEELLKSLGRLLGQIDSALQDFSHPAAQRELKWDLSAAGWIRKHLHEIADPSRRSLVEKFLTLYESEIVPALPQLRRSVIYGDANDHNVLVSEPWPLPRQAQSVIDFGDMHYGMTVSEVAIAAAYAMLGKKDVLRAAASVVSGYHEAFPLQEREIAASIHADRHAPGGQRHKFRASQNAEARRRVRHRQRSARMGSARAARKNSSAICALHLSPSLRPSLRCRKAKPSATGSKQTGPTAASLFDTDLRTAPASCSTSASAAHFWAPIRERRKPPRSHRKFSDTSQEADASIGVGRYNEARLLYTSPLFGAAAQARWPSAAPFTSGMDFFAAAGHRDPCTTRRHSSRAREQ